MSGEVLSEKILQAHTAMFKEFSGNYCMKDKDGNLWNIKSISLDHNGGVVCMGREGTEDRTAAVVTMDEANNDLLEYEVVMREDGDSSKKETNGSKGYQKWLMNISEEAKKRILKFLEKYEEIEYENPSYSDDRAIIEGIQLLLDFGYCPYDIRKAALRDAEVLIPIWLIEKCMEADADG